MSVVPSLTVKLPAVFGWMLALGWEPTVISLTEIIVMIDVPIEVCWLGCTDEYTASMILLYTSI